MAKKKITLEVSIIDTKRLNSYGNFVVRVNGIDVTVYTQPYANCQHFIIGSFASLIYFCDTNKVSLAQTIQAIKTKTSISKRVLVVDIRAEYLPQLERSDVKILYRKKYTSPNKSRMIMLWLDVPLISIPTPATPATASTTAVA